MSGLEGVTADQILALLAVKDIWDVVLYLILLFVLITLFMQPEGALTVTLLLAAVVVGIFIDKVEAMPGRHQCSFGTLIIRIMMFVIPLIVAGITKNPKARAPSVVAAVLGLGYTFLLWATEMNNRNVCTPLSRDISMIVDYIDVLLT